jgi:outer membrane protein assembly factor BamB
MKNSASLSIATLIAFTSISALANAWPNFRGPDHNGISKETGWSASWPAGGPKKLWKAKVGIGFASFAVSNGKVYTVGNANDVDSVYCFDAITGAEVWKQSQPAKLDPKYYEGGPSATPTVDGGLVYTLTKRGVAHCFDAAKGSVIWSKDLAQELKAAMPTWGFAGSVLIDGNLALLNVGSAGAALDKKSGKVVWSSGPEEAGYSSPVPFVSNGKRSIAMAIKRNVVALNVADGKEIWSFPWKTANDVNAADPVLSGDKVFISSGYGHGGGVFDVSVKPPRNVWENKSMRNHFSSSVLWKGHLYGLDENQLRCLVFETGEVKWTDKVTGKGSLMLADGKLIVLGEKGELMVADAMPDGFKPIARSQVLGGKCWTAPVLANGKIYCRNAAGDVVCVDVGGK